MVNASKEYKKLTRNKAVKHKRACKNKIKNTKTKKNKQKTKTTGII